MLLAVGAVAVDDGGTLPTEEVAQQVDDATLNPQQPLGGPAAYGASEESQVSLGSLKPKYTQADISLKGPVGTLTLSHTSIGGVSSLNKYGVPGGRPAPFGYIDGFGTPAKPRMRWVHNFHSFIVQREETQLPCPPGEECLTSIYWDVYGGPVGAVKTFSFCEQLSCFAASGSEQNVRLQNLGGALIVHAKDGRYVYTLENPGSEPTANNIWLLRFIEPPQYDEASCPPNYREDAGVDFAASCHRRIARLFYEVPSECAQGTAEEVAQTLGATSQLLRSAVATNGAKLVFKYQRLPSRVTDLVHKSHECVLSTVDLVARDGTVESSAVTYQYEQVTDASGTHAVAGQLAGVEYPDQTGGQPTGTRLEYSYQSSADAGVWSIKKDGVQVVRQVLGERGIVVEDSDGQGNLAAKNHYTVTAEDNGCAPGVFSATTGACKQQDHFFTTQGRTRGDGTGLLASEVKSQFSMSLWGKDPVGDQGPILNNTLTTVQCDGIPCLGAETEASRSSWFIVEREITATRTVEAPAGIRHPNGAYTVFKQELPADTSLRTKPFLPPMELQRVQEGALSDGGNSALLSRDYTYTYGGVGRAANERAYEQLIETSSAASTFSDEDSNLVQGVRRQYDPVTNRLTGMVRTGYTMKFSPQTLAWSRVPRSVGTFYLTQNVCESQPTNDSLGRVRAVVGPCDVASAQSTSCAAGTTVPLAIYDYWSASETGDRAGRLKSKSVYPNGCGSTPIVTTYDEYDPRGRLLQTTDANGGVTRYEYEGTKLVKKIAAFGNTNLEATTEYGYDDNATHGDYVRHPDGRYEVLCYRKNTLPEQGCKGGELTTLLQWKATSASAGGATHSERVDYTYHLGKLRSETFRDASNQVRRTRYYEGDPLERQTFEAWGAAGPSVPSETRYTQTSLFDAQGNKVGLGSPYQPAAAEPEPLCGGFDPNSLGQGVQRRPASPHCKAFAYDRLNRLAGLLEPIDGASNTGDAAKMCMSYDAAGNLRSVRQGCPRGTGSAGDCSVCTQPVTEYRHDDFGNVVRVDAPWGTGPKPSLTVPAERGRYLYEYDAAGNLVRKQTPVMAAAAVPQWVENGYDQMKRLLKSEAVKSVNGVESRETLFTYFYDQAVTPPWGCPGYAASKPSNAMGRAQVLIDSFGDSWYRYDAHGNLIATYRSRASSTSRSTPSTVMCYDAAGKDFPNTFAYYDRAGRMLTEVYPGGRTIQYNYSATATGLSHRIQSISVVQYSGTVWSGYLPIVEEIKWEPFGGVRSYVFIASKAATGAQRARVEYHTGGTNQPLASCSGTSFTSAGDTTGRISGLTVSRSEAGGSLGDLFKRAYTWKGDQLIQEDTCLLETGSVPPMSIRYADATSGASGYDARLQLKHAHRVSNASANAGGAYSGRAYQYDARGNRTQDVQDGWSFKSEYSTDGSRVDRLTTRYLEGKQCGGSICAPRLSLTQRYGYDADGRVEVVHTYKRVTDSTLTTPFFSLSLDADLDGAHAAIGAVYRQVSDSEGRTYEYFYDAKGRRRLKRYGMNTPQGVLEDEFFYAGTRLLEDWGNTTVDPSTADSVRDEYIWLDGRPIAFIKSRVNRTTTQGQRAEDFVGDCSRNGESAPCGLYFLVADNLGKPVLAFDAYRRVTGVADYDPYGHVNRTTQVADSPVLGAGQDALMATAQVPSSGSLVTQVRARFPVLDMEGGSGVYLADESGALLSGVDGQSSLLSDATAHNAVSRWVVPSSTGTVQVRFQSAADSGDVQDVVLGGMEYRRFQAGATPVWPRLRFPGQYHDEETDFFENWNRFYDPSVGRYLGPEPKAQEPSWMLEEVAKGRSPFIYVYANNNPVGFIDPEGLWTFSVGVSANLWLILGPEVSLQIVVDGETNVELHGSVGGKLGFGGGLGGGMHYSLNLDAETVDDLEGVGTAASFDLGPVSAGLGASVTDSGLVGPSLNFSGFPGVGLGLGPYAELNYTWELFEFR
ncbi:hypothetical protein LY474_31550 [Myxococcus stipitatus]|uniref:RHS repeat-associated core domain-containing protein n=1 Tax=Myxococcus stipitatus TaxID=83455 RepID=UPI001F20DF53|nr:RHS repeat-associated core domain-containing protein [Myxococcus stipitatus]MCE9672351.1 hypothetical protein [Myxococcus stipitatus]